MSSVRLFRIGGTVEITEAAKGLERPLQRLFEENLETLLGVRFLVTEYSTTNGRIDTLGLDEENCPVIIEYKRAADENMIIQGLSYFDWLIKNQADFRWLVMEKIGKEIAEEIDWSATRILLIAATFTKRSLDAGKQVDHKIEFISYRKFDGDLLMLDFLTSKTAKVAKTAKPKAATGTQMIKTKKVRSDSFAYSYERTDEKTKKLLSDLADFVCGLGDDVQGILHKQYKAFRRRKNFACVKAFKGKLKVYVNSNQVEVIAGFTRDVSGIGHHGTGNLEITIVSDTDLARAKPLIQKSYEAS